MAAVFPSLAVKREDGRYDVYFIDANGNETQDIATKEDLTKSHLWSLKTFGRPPSTKIIT